MSDEEPTYSDILESDFICLQAAGSGRKFCIHGDLLASKCKPIYVACTKEFQEKTAGAYTIQDTSDGTVVRFMEWAYKGNYSDDVKFNGVGDLTLKDNNERATNHGLLSHAEVYVFGHIYGISKLQCLAYEKLTKNIQTVGRPDNLDDQSAVIELLDTAFSRLHSDDRLLNWLGQYAAWCVNELRLQPRFYDVLPKFAYSIIQHISPASSAPWKTGQRELQIPHYKTYDWDVANEPVPEEPPVSEEVAY